jgi:hypothetical protein
MKTITSQEIIAAHGTETDITLHDMEETLREMLEGDAADSEWHILPQEDSREIHYVARTVGESGPVLLSFYDAVEPSIAFEGDAEKSLSPAELELLKQAWN